LTVAPVKPLTQSKKVVSKGKVVPHPTTQPHAHKVTRIASPMPEVADVEVPYLPITGPSQAGCAPLFEELVRSGDDHVGMEAPVPSGK